MRGKKVLLPTELLRHAKAVGLDLAQFGYTPTGEPPDPAHPGETAMYSVAAAKYEVRDMAVLSSIAPEVMRQVTSLQNGKGRLNGVLTGFSELDALTGGLTAGELVLLATRSAIDASDLALNFVRHAAVWLNRPTMLFMPGARTTEVSEQILSAQTSVPLRSLRNGTLTQDEWIRVAAQLDHLETKPLFIQEDRYLTPAKIRTQALRVQDKDNLALVVVDHLELLRHSRTHRVPEPDHQLIAGTVRALKRLALELDAPVVLVCRLNRNMKDRLDERPRLSDLRGSGTLEMDADMVIMLHRDEWCDLNMQPDEVDLTVAKHRNGPTGTIRLVHQQRYNRYVSPQAPESRRSP